MDSTLFASASRELRRKFISLLNALSAARALATLEVKQRTPQDVLKDALKVLIQHEDLERCSAFLLENDELICAAGEDFPHLFLETRREAGPEQTWLHNRFQVGKGILGVAVATKSQQYCPNCGEDPRFKRLHNAVEQTSGSLISTPAMSGDRVLAVVNVYHPENDFFQDWHQHTLSLFCGVLGHMLDNQQALQNLEAAVEQRTRQLEQALAEAEHLKRRYEQLSTIDELTSLHNRRFFYPEADAALSRAIRHHRAFCLMILDLDHFKVVNDAYGHAVGDRVLRDLAEVLRYHIREGDIVARFGGEEFVIALPETPLPGAKILAERIRGHVRELRWYAEGKELRVSVSIGITCQENGDNTDGKQTKLEELLRQADKALYYCKFHGRNQVKSYLELFKEELAAQGRL